MSNMHSTPAHTQPPVASPPTREHLEQIAQAKLLSAKIRRCNAVAAFSAWTTAIFGGITFLSSLPFLSVIGITLGAGMLVCAYIEFQAGAELKRLDLRAPRKLACNQLAFGAMLFLYGAYSLWARLTSPIDPELVRQLGEFKDVMNEVDSLMKLAFILLYVSVMAVAIIGPGLTAWYYYSRKKYLEAYVTQTPQWILDLQRAGMQL
jgi:hypothetical protein